ncbi:hypothetical protein [Campylobacter vulpis]|uniref:hypothetical protein n=1 Tax=Campylobacter vulpis TaxID=1655500 RepID=UPI000C1453D3|nr:hypothetical protein [Campylobacter vulpis]MBS4276047.1 hypothetical protein [Campylobacter vulpis]MBS4307424.1 hypothetical protein [Campylobacter vulpis]MBS4330365.1 hypothetical protein [Campylobacter vulpis]MBS4407339.1 hypothetical protein [Campylobacter vulpis]MBS4423935.1 hypothetical protein [Campylobacter vulpis]
MNYEHSALNDINAKIEQINTLISQVREEFNEAKAKELLSGSFKELEKAQNDKITETSLNAFTELKASMDNQISEKTTALFGENKTELLSLVLKNLNLENESEKIAREFLKQNKESFNQIARDFLEAENLESFIAENKEALKEQIKEFESEKEAKKEALNTALNELDLSVKRAVEIKADEELKSYIAKNSVEVFKPFSLHFLKDSFLNDEYFRGKVSAESKRATKEFLEQNHLESTSEALLKINADLAEGFFNSHFIKEQAFLQSLTLSAMNLNNELRHISEIMSNLIGFENGEDLANKKVFKVI